MDLGKPEEIVGVRIAWEKENAGYQYVIDGSQGGQTWERLVEEKNGPRPPLDEQRFSARDIQHVRITITQAPSGCWASFFEFEVLGKEMVEKPASLFDARLGGVQSPAGFEQTLFAAPPNVSYPVCLEATPWGDVFVGVDQNGSLDREKNRGWVVRCRDTNGDGEADEFVTFAKMDSPRGLVFDNNTLYVMHPPLLEAFHDTNGDGVADRSEVLVSGLGKDLDFRGADHTCNGVRMGIDGFLYVALGDYGAQKAVGKDGREVQVYGGGIVRVRPNGSGLEVVVEGTRNTYDVAIDPFMNLFTCDNTNDGDEWNLRLSHMIFTANYGYPSRYKNFSNEIMPAMRDFGGGSPTGVIFLDEPGFPDEFGHGLYTCQWGWNNVTRHPLKQSGATFAAGKETFVRVPRPTGIAADGQGNLYVASWKGGGFNYGGPNVGFVVRVSSLNNQPTLFPDLRKLADDPLLKLLASPSAVQRFHVQREILRRAGGKRFVNGLNDLARSDHDVAVRAAAVFTLGQMEGTVVSNALFKLLAEDVLRPLVLRALADLTDVIIPTQTFVMALLDKNPEVRLQAIIALSRLGRTESAAQVLSFAIDPDPAISHAAFRALVRFRAIDLSLQAVDGVTADFAGAGFRVLANIHDVRVVDELIQRLSSPQKSRILETLCRLYFREGEWDGSWWGTRPDSSGPYYKPVTWAGTDRIVSVLRDELAKNDAQTLRFLLVQFQKYKITSPEISPAALSSLVADTQLDSALRRTAFQNVSRVSDEAAVGALVAGKPDDKLISELALGFVKDPKRMKNLDFFAKLARADKQRDAELAYGALLHVAQNTNAPPAARALAEKSLQDGHDSDALQNAQQKFFPHDPPLASAPVASSHTIAKLAYEDVVKRMSMASADPKAGEKLFETVGCNKCHTVSKKEAPTGPFLGDIAVRYSREELLESILLPNAKIAQGFEATTIENKEGDSFDGFIVRESGDEVELRNISGATVIPKETIASRITRATSIMPEGLVDALTPEELSSLLHYLQSLAANK